MHKNQSKNDSFKKQDLYVGIDVHKKQWTIKVETKDIAFGCFVSIAPSPIKLSNYYRSISRMATIMPQSGFWISHIP